MNDWSSRRSYKKFSPNSGWEESSKLNRALHFNNFNNLLFQIFDVFNFHLFNFSSSSIGRLTDVRMKLLTFSQFNGVAFIICREFILRILLFGFVRHRLFSLSSVFSMKQFHEVICQLLIIDSQLPDLYYLVFYHSFFGLQPKLNFVTWYITFRQLVFFLDIFLLYLKFCLIMWNVH